MQHAKGRTGDCPGPRRETVTRTPTHWRGWLSMDIAMGGCHRVDMDPVDDMDGPWTGQAGGAGGVAEKRHRQEHRPRRPTERRSGDCPGPRKETATGRTTCPRKHSEAGQRPRNDPRDNQQNPQYANDWAPLTRKRQHIEHRLRRGGSLPSDRVRPGRPGTPPDLQKGCGTAPLDWPHGGSRGKGKGKVLGRSPNSSVSVIPTCPKAQHPTSHYTHQNRCNSGTVNSRDT